MSKRLIDFACSQGFSLTEEQAQKMLAYAQLVWQKRDMLNLTSAADLDEVINRHICDAIAGAAYLDKLAQNKNLPSPQIADVGSGAGYIGIVIAIALPYAKVTLVESLQKRCKFLNWAVLNLGLCNVQVKNVRLGEADLSFDFVTERAMGQIGDILGICLAAVKPQGAFVPYQSESSNYAQIPVQNYGGELTEEKRYTLPNEEKERLLVVFSKNK